MATHKYVMTVSYDEMRLCTEDIGYAKGYAAKMARSLQERFLFDCMKSSLDEWHTENDPLKCEALHIWTEAKHDERD